MIVLLLLFLLYKSFFLNYEDAMKILIQYYWVYAELFIAVGHRLGISLN